jgi:DNA-binding GntR family transcriptional regulator
MSADRLAISPSRAAWLMVGAMSDTDTDTEPASAEIEAYRHILTRIRRGELSPGARVRTEDVASAVGLSRQPVREAIRRLEAEGYLSSRPNYGAIVSKYTPAQLMELFEIRASLEGLAARVAASVLSAADIDAFEPLLAKMEAAGTQTDAWLDAHVHFHMHLAQAAGRPRLARELARLHAALEPYLRLWYVHTGTPTDSRAEHERLLQALRSGYPGHAEEVMRDHVLETVPQIIADLGANGQATLNLNS